MVNFLSKNFLREIENMFSMFLSSFGINLLAFYYEYSSLIGYTIHHSLVIDNE